MEQPQELEFLPKGALVLVLKKIRDKPELKKLADNLQASLDQRKSNPKEK